MSVADYCQFYVVTRSLSLAIYFANSVFLISRFDYLVICVVVVVTIVFF
jgi:hypothetical protein